MAPTMIDVPMDAEVLKELLPTPTITPTMVNIPVDSEILKDSCSSVATTIIREVRLEGVSGWWLVLTIAVALIILSIMGGILGASSEQWMSFRLAEELRNTPPHKLHEKLEERYLKLLAKECSSQLKGYKAKTYRNAIYEDNLVTNERKIMVIQMLSTDADENQNEQQPEPETQTRSQTQVQNAETPVTKDQEASESTEATGLMKDSDSDSWSDLSPEEKEKRPPRPWKSTVQK